MLIAFIPLFLFFIDQITKQLVKSSYIPYSSTPLLGDFLKLTHVQNPGIIFGLEIGFPYFLITFLTLCAVCYLIFLIINASSKYRLAYLFILGGALGNLYDRLLVTFGLQHGVIDFIDIGINGYRWYIFNFADIFISCGAIIILYLELFRAKPINNEI